jgi:hypothetical protein
MADGRGVLPSMGWDGMKKDGRTNVQRGLPRPPRDKEGKMDPSPCTWRRATPMLILAGSQALWSPEFPSHTREPPPPRWWLTLSQTNVCSNTSNMSLFAGWFDHLTLPSPRTRTRLGWSSLLFCSDLFCCALLCSALFRLAQCARSPEKSTSNLIEHSPSRPHQRPRTIAIYRHTPVTVRVVVRLEAKEYNADFMLCRTTSRLRCVQ